MMRYQSVRFVFSSLRSQIISNALSQVPKHGWTSQSILRACHLLELSPAANGMISPYELIVHQMGDWNRQALRQLRDSSFHGRTRISDRISQAIRVRLSLQIPFLDTWHQAMAIGAKPTNIPTTAALLWDYSSAVWTLCGDKSLDYNYYTKRSLFNAVYASTELFLLTDRSEGYFATWDFLDRRIKNVLDLGAQINMAKQLSDSAFEGVLNIMTSFTMPPTIQHPIHTYQSHPQSQKVNNSNSASIQSETVSNQSNKVQVETKNSQIHQQSKLN